MAVGVPAPVDRDGRTTFQDNPFWELMNPDIGAHLRDRHGWTILTDNDANLAAVAEHWRGHGATARCHVTLLAGERFGAGVVDDGRLLRGAHGGVGEMRYLDFVDGVGSADGIAALVREDARAQLHRLDGRTGSSLQDVDPATLDAASVFAAALDEDPLAVERRRARGGAPGARRRDVREHLRPGARHHRRRRRRRPASRCWSSCAATSTGTSTRPASRCSPPPSAARS